MITRAQKRITPVLYVVPALLFVLLITIYPMVSVFIYSFTNWSGVHSSFVGFSNFTKILTDEVFWNVVSHNFILLLVIPIEVVIGIFIAFLIYEHIFGWKAYQIILFLPQVFSVVVSGIVWTYLYSYEGIINQLLTLAGLSGWVRLWLADLNFALPSVMLVVIWRDLGFAIVLFLASLLNIDPAIFEASIVDGASKLQRFGRIAIPQLVHIIEVYVVLNIIWIFNSVFDYIYVMTAGGPGYRTTVIEYYIYYLGFRQFKFGYASAVSVMLFFIILIFVVVQIAVMRKRR